MAEIVMLDAGGSVSRVVVVFGAGGALRLGEWSDPADARAAAEVWASALHREGRGGCVVITR
jgi:hypothetical protein